MQLGSRAIVRELRRSKFPARCSPGAHCCTWGQARLCGLRRTSCQTPRASYSRISFKRIFPGQSLEGTVPIVIIHFPHLNNYQFYHRCSNFFHIKMNKFTHQGHSDLTAHSNHNTDQDIRGYRGPFPGRAFLHRHGRDHRPWVVP